MPLSRWAQRSARVVALGAAALGLGPRTRPPAPVPLAAAPAAGEGAEVACQPFGGRAAVVGASVHVIYEAGGAG